MNRLRPPSFSYKDQLEKEIVRRNKLEKELQESRDLCKTYLKQLDDIDNFDPRQKENEAARIKQHLEFAMVISQ
jgi:hypothetical protein